MRGAWLSISFVALVACGDDAAQGSGSSDTTGAGTSGSESATTTLTTSATASMTADESGSGTGAGGGSDSYITISEIPESDKYNFQPLPEGVFGSDGQVSRFEFVKRATSVFDSRVYTDVEFACEPCIPE